MKKFLRYKSRHSLYWPGDGRAPELNPLSSRSHSEISRRPTARWDEPTWLFRLRQAWFCVVERQRCADRGMSMAHRGHMAFPDTWDLGPDGMRTCSYCGSIHFEDLMKIAQLTLDNDAYGVEATDKGYKYYVRQPGVRNACEGAIKFYTGHVPRVVTPQQEQLFAQARRITHERFSARWKQPVAV